MTARAETETVVVTRDMLFVSHANPEDNEFTRWIALQLANEGYGVWCDLTKLLGGERFWDDIDEAIRKRTAKFLFVLSRVSNVTKESPRDELELAHTVRRAEKLGDFIIPLWIDSLSSNDFHVRLQSLNAVRFQEGWRSGLDSLLKKLEKDSVPKLEGFGPTAVRSWWRTFRDPRFAVRETPEILLTNWHSIAPAEYYVHSLERVDQSGPGPLSPPDTLPYPAVPYNQYLVSFAPTADLVPHMGSVRIHETRQVTLGGSANEEPELLWSRKDRSTTLIQLLNQSWQQMVTRRGLPTSTFSGGQPSLYFKKGTAAEDKVEYIDSAGKKHWRNVVGISTLGTNPDGSPRLRYWHFGLEARGVMKPRPGFLIKPHVLFSDDGELIWTSSARLHRARRSQCKGWWNDKWRDLILGTMAWIANGSQVILLPVSQKSSVSVSITPLQFESPFSYDEAELDRVLNPDDMDVDDIDQDVLEEDSDAGELAEEVAAEVETLDDEKA